MEQDGFIIQDGENYQSKEIGIKQIALEQYRRCAIEGSKNIINDPIQREIYVNSVKSMEIILFPDILNHDDIKTKIAINEDRITSLEEEYAHKLRELREQVTDDKRINLNKLTHHYEKILIELIQEKLVILGLLLKKINYYGESTISE